MKAHIISLQELQDWYYIHKVNYTLCSTKRIDFTLNGGIEIHTKKSNESWVESKLHWQGLQLYSAVDVYNELF